MSDSLQSSRLEALFESALHDYEQQTGIPLAKHPLAEQLQNCQSVDSITTLLQEQAQDFSEFRGSDKIMKSLKSVVSALSRVSAVAAVGHNVGVSIPHAQAIHTGLGILLTAFKGVTADFDALVDFFESIELFLNRLDIYTKVTPTPAMNEIVVKIMVELLSTLALVTKQIKQGRPKKFVKKLFGENGVEAVLQRLDRLTQEEARMTAAQTLEVVYGLFQSMRVVVDDGKASADNVRSVLEIIQEMASETNKSKRDKLQQDIRSWLSPPDPWKNHNLARGSRHTGTATWFAEGGTLSEWKSSCSSSLLWVHGKPGAGKSVLCSTIIEDVESMRKSGLASLAFFYYDFREDAKKDLRGLLSSVLVQLCHQSDSYYQIISSFYSEHANGSRHPSDDDLIQRLKDILKVPGQAPIYLIVDGLDECSNTPDTPSPREKVLMLFEDLFNLRLPNLRICITSRPEIDIKVALEPLIFRSVSLHDESEQRRDIENYIKSVVNTDPKMRRWKATDKELVIDVLIKKSDGMFRWVYCQIDYLRRCLPPRIRHALNELPETLDATYDRALREIDKANWEFAYRLLQCVAVAFRPLHVKELAEILSLDFKIGPVPKFREGWRQGDPVDAVLSTTSSLLAIVDNQGSRVIQFSHFSVKEYLTASRLAETNDIISRYHISLTLAHTLTAQACLGILLHLDESVVSRDNLLEEYPLAKYAAEHWMDHARFEGVSEYVEDGMKQLLDPSKPHLVICRRVYDPMSGGPAVQAKWPFERRTSPLHYAAYCGLHFMVKFLVVEHLQDVDSPHFSENSTALHLASKLGHEDVVQRLLEHDADITARNSNGMSPLHVASANGHQEVALLLLKHGADLTAQGTTGSSPLHVASQCGNEEVALLLLEHGADLTAEDNYGGTPLHYASVNQPDGKVARLLLEHDADLTAQDQDGQTPLHTASLHGREKAALLFLDHGADLTAQDQLGRSPIHLASQYGKEKVSRLLLEHGADLTAQDEDGRTPLHLASYKGRMALAQFSEHEKVVLLLLEHGADLTAQDDDGWNPIHVASQNGDEKVARLLLEHGADVIAQNNDGNSPLHLASFRGHDKVTRLLLKHGADTTVQNKDGRTSLHQASECGHDDIALLLLENGADVTAQTEDGRTPLHLALSHGHAKVARLLLEHGADTTVQNEDGRTLLHQASECGHEDIALLLLEHEADTTAQDSYGQTPLHLASSWGKEKVARLLLEHGADVTARDKSGSTALQLASRFGFEDIALLLLEHHANSTTQDKDGLTSGREDIARSLVEHSVEVSGQTKVGWTPLHLAAFHGHDKDTHSLLEHGAETSARIKDGWTPLHLASQNGHEKDTLLLLEHGAEASAQIKDGWNSLHLASENGHEKVALLLLEHGADSTAQEKNGWTPLHLASENGHEKVALLLLEHGAGSTARTKDGRTPLHLASENGHEKVARVLLEHGADATAQTNTCLTSLDVAVRHGRAEAVSSFLEYGTDVTAQRKDGSNLLHLASRWGHVDIARVLFEHGVDAITLNNRGWNALHLASHWGHLEVVQFLLDHGADPTVQNKYGWAPLRLALRGGHVEVARLLQEHGADTTREDEQVAARRQVVLDQEDLGLANLFPRDADASNHPTAWSSIIHFIAVIIARCYMLLARAILGK